MDESVVGTEKCYRTSHFANLQRSSTISNNDSLSLASNCETLSPIKMAFRLYALGQHEQALKMMIALREEGKGEWTDGDQGREEKELLVGIANCYFQLARYEESVSLYRSILTQHLTS
jgi:tetratricopeptide (TPR) repeat protein